MAIFNSKLFNYQTLELLHIFPPVSPAAFQPLEELQHALQALGGVLKFYSATVPPSWGSEGWGGWEDGIRCPMCPTFLWRLVKIHPSFQRWDETTKSMWKIIIPEANMVPLLKSKVACWELPMAEVLLAKSLFHNMGIFSSHGADYWRINISIKAAS
jgi:hypothetical protein